MICKDGALLSFRPPFRNPGGSSVDDKTFRAHGASDVAGHRFNSIERLRVSHRSHESAPREAATCVDTVSKSANYSCNICLLPWAAAAQTPATMPDYTSAIRTPPAPVTPRINGPRVYGARPGHPFFYHLPVTGQRPITITADGLPAGLTLDGSTGNITGAVAQAGEHACMQKNVAGAFAELNEAKAFFGVEPFHHRAGLGAAWGRRRRGSRSRSRTARASARR